MRLSVRNKRDNPNNSTNSCDDSDHPRQVRQIRPTRRSVSGVYSFRQQSPIPFESTLERDFIMRSEFFNHVSEIIPQPIEIPFRNSNGREFTYTPDFLVYHRLGDRHYEDYPVPLLVEVKPETQWRANYRKWFPKWKAARRLAIERGWRFTIHDETRIRDRALENIRFLQRYKRQRFSEADNAMLMQSLFDMGTANVDYLIARHYQGEDRAIGITHLWHLLATRQIDCDINRKLSGSTELWIPAQ